MPWSLSGSNLYIPVNREADELARSGTTLQLDTGKEEIYVYAPGYFAFIRSI